MAQIARGKEPYWLAIEAMGYVVDAIPQSLTASDVYRLWGELSDRHELRPEKDTDTEVLMRRAASEWLETKDDPVARDKYLDRWLYDVCGYERAVIVSGRGAAALIEKQRPAARGARFCNVADPV